MKWMLFFGLLSLNLSSSFAAQTNEFRNPVKKEIFSIKELKGKKQNLYIMQSAGSGINMLKIKKNAKVLEFPKIGAKLAKKLDHSFADSFISMKYIDKLNKKDKCTPLYKLSLRGDKLSVCSEEKKKVDVIVSFLQEIEKVFLK